MNNFFRSPQFLALKFKYKNHNIQQLVKKINGWIVFVYLLPNFCSYLVALHIPWISSFSFLNSGCKISRWSVSSLTVESHPTKLYCTHVTVVILYIEESWITLTVYRKSVFPRNRYSQWHVCIGEESNQKLVWAKLTLVQLQNKFLYLFEVGLFSKMSLYTQRNSLLYFCH